MRINSLLLILIVTFIIGCYNYAYSIKQPLLIHGYIRGDVYLGPYSNYIVGYSDPWQAGHQNFTFFNPDFEIIMSTYPENFGKLEISNKNYGTECDFKFIDYGNTFYVTAENFPNTSLNCQVTNPSSLNNVILLVKLNHKP